MLDTEYTDVVAGIGSGFGNPWRQGQDEDVYSLEAVGVDEEAGRCGIMIAGEQNTPRYGKHRKGQLAWLVRATAACKLASNDIAVEQDATWASKTGGGEEGPRRPAGERPRSILVSHSSPIKGWHSLSGISSILIYASMCTRCGRTGSRRREHGPRGAAGLEGEAPPEPVVAAKHCSSLYVELACRGLISSKRLVRGREQGIA